MGFSQAQVKQLFGTVPNVAGQSPQESLAVVSALITLGLNAGSVLCILEKCPELFRMKCQLQPRVDNLRKLGLVEGSLQRVVAHCPQILSLSPKQINNTVRFLKERCLFTGQQVTEILRTAPNVLFENTIDFEYKFQYVYFRMGIKQPEMLKSDLLRVSKEKVKWRHSFLERLGYYETPDKKGQTQIVNPKLRDIVGVSEEVFLTKVARSTQEEFDVFKKLLDREETEGSSEDEDLDGESEEEDDDS
ncbi:transcription termination factor 4, mitochondrial-like [Latimeria chalumnae]|uniref:transcription termination factor 4, mitochondrial-like n=1 Tax=Latimeria chalumnae TaxID=7897 RepID=UPI00313EB553